MNRVLLTASLLIALVLFSEAAPNKSIARVWFFVATDCPIANSYAPEMNRLFEEYEAQGIAFSLIYPDTGLTGEKLAAHREAYELKIEGQIDFDHSLVKKAGVTTTPEVAVFDSTGSLIYRGMIDDLYTDFGDRRRTPSKRFLRQVLEKLLSTKPVKFHETKPVGCLIELIK